jgi:hypothetical protein
VPLLPRDAGRDVRSNCSDLVVAEPAVPARAAAFAMRMPSACRSRIRERSNCASAEQVQHQLSECVVYAGSVGLLFRDELDGGALRDNLVDDVAEISQGAHEVVNRDDSDEVAVSDVLEGFAELRDSARGSRTM